MRFRILGPLEVERNGRCVTVGGPQQQALLAIFLLHANQVVSTDRLIEHLWGEQTPAGARDLLQGCVARLRKVLKGDGGQPLVTRAPGYVLEVRPGELDRDRFEESVAAAQALAGKRSVAALEERSALLSGALALWRGPVLDGIPLDACQVEASYLEERRLAAVEERIDVDLRLGRHTHTVGELRTYVRTHPLRERFWALLMAALARTGRQADALAAFRQLRETLIDQLGVEPSTPLQELHLRILAGNEASSSLGDVGIARRVDASHGHPGALRTSEQAEQRVRFTTVNGRRVAWSIVGSGPLLVIGGWFCSHLELDWCNPPFQRFIGALAEQFTVVRYDRPGSGLSDRHDLPSHEPDDEIAVLAAIVDEAAGTDGPVSLFGGSSGGCAAVAYAAQHPQRVDRLVLYGSYTNGAEIADRQDRESLLAIVGTRGGVGRRLLADIFIPNGTTQERDEFVEFLRASASPAITQASLRMVYGFDIRDQASQVRAPTLVVHRRNDRAVPFALGQDLARRIPGASFVALDGRDHIPWRGNAEIVVRTVLDSLEEGRAMLRATEKPHVFEPAS